MHWSCVFGDEFAYQTYSRHALSLFKYCSEDMFGDVRYHKRACMQKCRCLSPCTCPIDKSCKMIICVIENEVITYMHAQDSSTRNRHSQYSVSFFPRTAHLLAHVLTSTLAHCCTCSQHTCSQRTCSLLHLLTAHLLTSTLACKLTRIDEENTIF